MVNQKDLKCWQKVPDLGMNSNNTAGPPPPRLPAAIKPRMNSLQSQRKMEKKLKKQNVQNDENKENGGNIAAFFTQRSKTSNATSGPSPRGLPANIRPQLDPLQNQSPDYISWLRDPKQSLIRDPDMVSVEDLKKQLQSTGAMPALPVPAKATSDLKSDPPPGLPATIRPQMDPLQKQPQFTGSMPPLPADAMAKAASDLESEQGNDKNKENGGSSIAPLFSQVSQASNSTALPPLMQPLAWLIQPRLDPVPAMVSIECLVLVYVGPK